MIAPTRAVPGRAKLKEPAPQAVQQLSVGSIVAGRFRLDKLLGEGGMGAVWSARHIVTKRAVAIKLLKEPASRELVERFVREAQAANAVHHPNVVEVHDFFELGTGLPAMVMDLFEGETLASQLERSGALPLPELARIMTRVVSALSAIHAAGIVHRDLKPENIFMAQLADGRVEPMVLDFGICKLDAGQTALAQSDASTTAGRIIGTPCYMAPEQVRGSAGIDARTDVWGLGVILFECATGTRPFDGESMAQVVGRITVGPIPRVEDTASHLPASLANVINRMLVRDREARLSDLREVLPPLQALASAGPVPSASSGAALRSLSGIRSLREAREAETVARAKITSLAPSSLNAYVDTSGKQRRRGEVQAQVATAQLKPQQSTTRPRRPAKPLPNFGGRR